MNRSRATTSPLPLLLALALLVAPFAVPVAAGAAVGREKFRFQDPAIVESSGLVHRGTMAFTVNDKGDVGRVFSVDASTGDTVGVTRWSTRPVDVEALAPAPDGRVWVGDIGDNGATRGSVKVARVPVGRFTRSVTPRWFRLGYPGGAQDAEALMRHPGDGRLVVVTKAADSGEVLAAPSRLAADRVNQTTRRGGVIRMVTDGAFFADGRHFVVRNYTRAAVYTWPGLVQVGQLDLPYQRQGEGLAVRSYRNILLSSEGTNQPVLAVTLPADVVATISPR